MAGKQLTNGVSFKLSGGRYHVSYYSASSGTGKLQFAPDGSNFHDVADSSKSASADIILEVGALDEGNFKAVLTGDMEMYVGRITRSQPTERL